MLTSCIKWTLSKTLPSHTATTTLSQLWRELPTTGKAKPDQRYIDIARELNGWSRLPRNPQHHTNQPRNSLQKNEHKPTKIVELSNPKIVTMTCLRSWLLPSLMEFLSVNQSVEFPQKIFELGKVTLLDETKETRTRDEDWLAAANYSCEREFQRNQICLRLVYG